MLGFINGSQSCQYNYLVLPSTQNRFSILHSLLGVNSSSVEILSLISVKYNL